MNNYFSGRDGFVWFTGVVEDRNDPSKLGRVRVRCFGYHTEDKIKIKTEDLPWSWVMMPNTSTSMNGLGETPSFIVEGSWVIGFFRDPETMQEPVIMGTLPGIPSESADSNLGFNDPRTAPDYGPYPLRTNDSDVNRLAKNDTDNVHPEIATRDTSATASVPIANVTTTWNELKTTDDSTRGATASGTNPETAEDRSSYKRRNSEYPYNHVRETESGHVKEYDDTPFAERIYESHRTGTFYEIDADGNKVTRVVGNDYEIVAGDSFCNIKGNVNLTIDANCNTYIKGDWNIQVDGSKTEVVKKDVTETYTGNLTTSAKTMDIDATGGNIDMDSSGNILLN